MSMAINFNNVGIYNEKFPSISSQDPLITWSQKSHIKYFSCCITTTTSPMATKLRKRATYDKKLQPIRSHKPLNPWSREVISTTTLPMTT